MYAQQMYTFGVELRILPGQNISYFMFCTHCQYYNQFAKKSIQQVLEDKNKRTLNFANKRLLSHMPIHIQRRTQLKPLVLADVHDKYRDTDTH